MSKQNLSEILADVWVAEYAEEIEALMSSAAMEFGWEGLAIEFCKQIAARVTERRLSLTRTNVLMGLAHDSDPKLTYLTSLINLAPNCSRSLVLWHVRDRLCSTEVSEIVWENAQRWFTDLVAMERSHSCLQCKNTSEGGLVETLLTDFASVVLLRRVNTDSLLEWANAATPLPAITARTVALAAGWTSVGSRLETSECLTDDIASHVLDNPHLLACVARESIRSTIEIGIPDGLHSVLNELVRK